MKKCSRCKQGKDEGGFYKNSQYKDGLQYICKACAREYAYAYRSCRRAHKCADQCTCTGSTGADMGIYQIRNVLNGKIYIGSSVSLSDRKNNHFAMLRSGKHKNVKLQYSFNKHGESAFVFEVLETIHRESEKFSREQYYLDTLKPFGENGYNIIKVADHVDVVNRLGKVYSFVSPLGQLIIVRNLNGFCRENNLIDSRMHEVLRGKRRFHKGYMSIDGYADVMMGNPMRMRNRGRAYPSRRFTLVDPLGVPHSEPTMRAFTKYGLNDGCVYKVFNKTRTHHVGWHLPGVDDSEVVDASVC